MATVSSGKWHWVHSRTPAPRRISPGQLHSVVTVFAGLVVQSLFCQTSASCLCLAQISPDPLYCFVCFIIPSILRCLHSKATPQSHAPGLAFAKRHRKLKSSEVAFLGNSPYPVNLEVQSWKGQPLDLGLGPY